MITPPRTTRSARRHPTTLAAAAAMTGLLVLSQPGLAHAATTADEGVKTTVLHPTVSGTDGTVRYSLASLAGGGVQLSFVYVPNETAEEASGGDQTQHKDFTLTVDAKALATQTVVDDGDGIVPAASTDKGEGDDKSDKTGEGEDQKKDPAEAETPNARVIQGKTTSAIVDQDVSQDSTKVTLQASTTGEQTIWVLPEQAPAAKDPDDQSWVTRTWHALLSKITGDDDSSSSEDGSNGTDNSSDNGTDQGEDTPTSAPTTSPTSSATTSPTSSASSSSDGSASSSPSTSSSTGTPTSTATAGDDTCVITHGDPQLTTTTADDDTVDAPLVDGPSAAPTFSEEVRKKAAQLESECGEGSGDSGSGDGNASGNSGEATGSGTLSSGKTKVNLKAGDWLSGISDERAAMEKLRGVDAEVATTWADASGDVAQLAQGAEYGPDKWDKSLIIGIPPFPKGSSWEATAAGENDDYLRKTFSSIASKWGDRNGQAFVEFGWEMNGYWMWWNAKAGQEAAVGKAFARARSIQQAEAPKALLGTRFNHESNGYDGNSEDLITSIKDFVDFVGASYYDAYPSSPTKAAFDERADMRDGGGGPKGIRTWLAAAKAAGLPIEFGEWASSAKDGDHPAFIDGMHDEFAENAGPGAGQIFAEAYFNVNKDDDNWRINSGKLPQSEAAYAKAFANVGAGS